MVQISQPYMTTGKITALIIWIFIGKVMSLLFNTLTTFVIGFFPRRMHLLISWLQSPSSVILDPRKIKSITASTFSPSICHEVMAPDSMILVFLMLCFKPLFQLSSFTLIKRLFNSSLLSSVRVVSEIVDISPSNLRLGSVIPENFCEFFFKWFHIYLMYIDKHSSFLHHSAPCITIILLSNKFHPQCRYIANVKHLLHLSLVT